MGAVFSSLWSYWWPSDQDYKIIMVGLDNAGKTTILYKLALGEVIVSQATVGSNVERVKHNNVELEIWDLGGQQNLRPVWVTYYKNTSAVIMVVDSTDRVRVGITKAELFALLAHEDLANVPILVLANKQDMKDAMTVEELSQSLALHTIKGHEHHIQACCALTGEGLHAGMDWVSLRTKAGAQPQQEAEKQAAKPS